MFGRRVRSIACRVAIIGLAGLMGVTVSRAMCVLGPSGAQPPSTNKCGSDACTPCPPVPDDQGDQGPNDDSDRDGSPGEPKDGQNSAGPIVYATGLPMEEVADFRLPGRGPTWEHVRYSNAVPRTADSTFRMTYTPTSEDVKKAEAAISGGQLISTMWYESGGSFQWIDDFGQYDTVGQLCGTIVPGWQRSAGASVSGMPVGALLPTSTVVYTKDPCFSAPFVADVASSIWPDNVAQGANWTSNYGAFLSFDDNANLGVWDSDNESVYYWHDNSRVYKFFGYSTVLTEGAAEVNKRIRSRLYHAHAGDPNDTFRLQKPDGQVWLFYDFTTVPGRNAALKGKLWKIVDVYGEGLTLNYDPNNDFRLDYITDAAGRHIQYDYRAANDPNNGGYLSSIEVWDSKTAYDSSTLGAKIAEIVYNYVGDDGVSTDCGEKGDLVGVTVATRTTAQTENTLEIVKQTHYRYYRDGFDSHEGHHDLRYIFRPQAVRRAILDQGISDFAGLLSASNSTVSAYASNEFIYNSDGRVSQENVSGNAGCCGGGATQAGTYLFQYTTFESQNPGRNLVHMETRETRPDGSTKWVETNVQGETILVAVYAKANDGVPDPNGWNEVWQYERNEQGQIETIHTPSAIESYCPGSAGTRSVSPRGDGLVYEYRYYDETKDYRLQSARRRMDSDDFENASYLEYRDWTEATYDPCNPYRKTLQLAEIRTYPTETTDPNDPNCLRTTYAYTYHLDPNNVETDRVKTVTVTHPSVSAGQNGSGIAVTTRRFYDTKGRLRWDQNGEGRLTYYSYDERNGQRALTVTDAYVPSTGSILPAVIGDPNDPNFPGGDGYVAAWTSTDDALLPTEFRSGGSLPASDFAQLINRTSYDNRGRVRRVTTPDGRMTCYAYVNAGSGIQEIRTYPAWDSATGRPLLPMSRRYTTYDTASYTTWSQSADPNGVNFNNPPTGAETCGGNSWPSASQFVTMSAATYQSVAKVA